MTSLPRFTAHASPVSMTVVGTAAGPTSNPDALIRSDGNGLLTYQTLYAAPGPDQSTQLHTTPAGHHGQHTTRAGKGR